MCHPYSYTPCYTECKIYRELAEQKKEKALRDSGNIPKERNAEKEQAASIEEIRIKEESCQERCDLLFIINSFIKIFLLKCSLQSVQVSNILSISMCWNEMIIVFMQWNQTKKWRRLGIPLGRRNEKQLCHTRGLLIIDLMCYTLILISIFIFIFISFLIFVCIFMLILVERWDLILQN